MRNEKYKKKMKLLFKKEKEILFFK